MRKFITILTGIFMLFSLAKGQNGFEIQQDGIEFLNYAVDESGNYWFVTSDVLYKKQGDDLFDYSQTNTNLDYAELQDIIIHEDGMYVIADNKIFDFNFEDPESCVDLGIDDPITKAFLSNGKLVVFTTPTVPNLKVQVYDNSEWSEADDLPSFGTIKSAAFINGNYYFILRNFGLYKYDLDEFTLISDLDLNDLKVSSGILWALAPNGIYILQNGELVKKSVLSAYYGGDKLNVMNGELWAGRDNQILKIEMDRIQGFEIPDNFTGFPRCLADQELIEFASGSIIYTFNPDEYISDPQSINPENLRFLDVNNVEAALNTRNSIFWDARSSAHYKVPKDGDASSIFATAIWFAGKDAEGDLRVSADKFDQNNRFKPGPLRLADAETDEGVMDQFNRIWKVDRATIENFKYRFENGEVQNGNWPIDYDIANWPAHGPDGYADNLAPFVDVNEDGVYNPMDGDYPDITGDQMLYWIVNDYNGGTPLNNDDLAAPLGIEVHFKAWANVYEDADSDSLEAINNATFLDVEIINRSDESYTDFYAALWSDADLGYSYDDFIECDVMNHSFFVYNGDVIDDPQANPPGYGEYPPAQSFMFLDAPVKYSIPDVDTGIYMSSFMYFANGAGAYGDPEVASDYYNYMTAKWKDSTEVTFGGNGINETDVPCRYMFPGNSDIIHNIGTGGVEVPDWNIWAMYNNGSTPSDVRGVAANGPYSIEPGESVTYRFAFAWARDEENGSGYPSYFKLKSILPYFHQWQRSGEFPSNYNFTIVPVGINPQPASALGVKLYPNPANSSVTLTCDAEHAVYRIYSLSGRLMKTGKVTHNSEQIRLDNMNPGMYVVHITDGKVSVTEKLILEF